MQRGWWQNSVAQRRLASIDIKCSLLRNGLALSSLPPKTARVVVVELWCYKCVVGGEEVGAWAEFRQSAGGGVRLDLQQGLLCIWVLKWAEQASECLHAALYRIGFEGAVRYEIVICLSSNHHEDVYSNLWLYIDIILEMINITLAATLLVFVLSNPIVQQQVSNLPTAG